MVEAGARIAIFTDADGGGSRAVKEGETIGPFTVVAIQPAAAQLSGPSGAFVVEPSPHQGSRAYWISQAPLRPLIDPAYREAFTENNQ